MGRIARTYRKPEEIRELIENSGLPYILVNNRIFEQFYEVGKGTYTPYAKEIEGKKGEYEYFLLNGDKVPYSESKIEHGVNFDERDITIFILLTFLDQIDFQGYTVEIANYLGTKSDKRIKERIKKLKFLQGEVNSYRGSGERKYYSEPRKDRFITEKNVKGFENGKQVTLNRWYVNYECDYKQTMDKDGNIIDKPENFFMVTIYDLDLLTSGQLTEKEFVTYLYLIKSYNSAKNDAIYQTISTISDKINIQDRAITKRILEKLVTIRVKDKFCDDGKDFPLVHFSKPANYEDKLAKRLEPSLKYYPIYNTTTLQKLKGEDVIAYPTAEESAENKTDSELNKVDTNLLVDSDLNKTDSDYDYLDGDILF
ncbi:hypothetical protein [Schinkia azotoformans]|uniref:hypothetical protein n=1 Tax=Schinkia azotoformans TaxID=1454 RepID=UPI002DBAEB61|nr:hypothetical protein [Schinkia azotoformans]MEC1780053.1 hypothetical protein [Schinkia azotoformans]MED4330868.1 hypothetical protein [Schinkia azotoformans]